MSRIKIISEIGINHDCLYTMAAVACAQAVKFQYRNLDKAYSFGNVREIGYEIISPEIRKAFLTPEQLPELACLSRERGLEMGISFFDVQDIQDFGMSVAEFDFFQSPSAELINALMALDHHLYISPGLHTEAEIEVAFSRLPPAGWSLMHSSPATPCGCRTPSWAV